MAFSESIARRVRQALQGLEGLSERRMFGGVAFMLNGHMCCGVNKEDVVLRLGEEGAAQALAQPHARVMDFTGRPMKGMVYVSPEGLRSQADLQAWVERAVAFVQSLPPKSKP